MCSDAIIEPTVALAARPPLVRLVVLLLLLLKFSGGLARLNRLSDAERALDWAPTNQRWMPSSRNGGQKLSLTERARRAMSGGSSDRRDGKRHTSPIKRLLDRNGNGRIDHLDFVPSFLDRDHDGKISVKDAVHDIKKHAHKQAAAYMRNRIEEMFVTMYVNRLKPRLTPDRRMPWMLRHLIHEVANDVWEMVMVELPQNLDKIFTDQDELDEHKEEALVASDKNAAWRVSTYADQRPRSSTRRTRPAAALGRSRDSEPARLPPPPSAPPSPPLHESPPLAPPGGGATRTTTAKSCSSGSLYPSGKHGGHHQQHHSSRQHHSFFPHMPHWHFGRGHGHVGTPTAKASRTISKAAKAKLDRDFERQVHAEKQAAAKITASAKRKTMQKAHVERATWAGRRRRWTRHARWRLRNAMLSCRAWLLYHHAPYDRTVFGRFALPPSILLLVISAWPSWYVRAPYFTIVFACLLPNFEEFQLMRFILALKGSQTLSGVANSVITAVQMWSCVVFQPGTCPSRGPGVSAQPNLVLDLCMIVWLQLLVWTAFVLLPYSSKIGEQQGALSLAGRSHVTGGGGRGGGGAGGAGGEGGGHKRRIPHLLRKNSSHHHKDGYVEMREVHEVRRWPQQPHTHAAAQPLSAHSTPHAARRTPHAAARHTTRLLTPELASSKADSSAQDAPPAQGHDRRRAHAAGLRLGRRRLRRVVSRRAAGA